MSIKPKTNDLKDNQSTAAHLMSAYKNYDKWAVQPVVIKGRDETGGFPAQYHAGGIPPLLEKQKYLSVVNGGAQERISIPFTDRDVEAIKKKEEMALLAEFDMFVSQNFDPKRNPAKGEWLQKVYPEFFESRKKEKDETHRLRSQYEDIILYGPKNKDDLYLLYRLNSDDEMKKRITGVTGYQDVDVRGVSDSKFQRGLWNTRQEDRLRSGIGLGQASYIAPSTTNRGQYVAGYERIIGI